MARRKPEFKEFPPYNPLHKNNLGESVADALLTSEMSELPPTPFKGSGVYAIYYTGDFPPYGKIRAKNSDEIQTPIYVGKAVPKGARKGIRKHEGDSDDQLFQRLKEHADSIRATDLLLDDFKCRFLVVDDIWIPLGESLLIQKFNPLWNVLLDGFGNHDPGGKRLGGETSRWDTVHPGRLWVEKREQIPNPKPIEHWLQEIDMFLTTGISVDLVREDEVGYSAEEDAE